MRLRRWLIVVALLTAAAALAAANIWFTAARSTIPLRLEGIVARKETRHEKHPPRDDVWLLDLRPGGVVQVDETVFDQVAAGDELRKDRWSRRLLCNERPVDLKWSADFYGMLWAMPLSMAVIVFAAVWTSAKY